MNNKIATIFDIQRNSYVDGPGIRTTVFFKGCNLRCAWCHNPESQSTKPQMMFYKSKCTSCGKCREICPYALSDCSLCGKCVASCPHHAKEICGRDYTVEELLKVIVKDRRFYQASGGGVTFSGGECMLAIDFLEEILKACKANGIQTAIDTAGHVPYERFERILPSTDLILYDVKCIDRERHLRHTGVENDLILENLKRLLATDTPIHIRIPVIPTVNDSVEEAERIRNLLRNCPPPKEIELLPYHTMGEYKYDVLKKEPDRFPLPDADQLLRLCKILNEIAPCKIR